MNVVVGLLTVELHVPGARSLKDKRMVLRRVKDRLKKFNDLKVGDVIEVFAMERVATISA